MSTVAAVRAARPPLWRDVRVLRIVGQIVFVLVVLFVLREMYLNATFTLDQRGRELSYSYLENRAGFGIKESILTYSANQPFYRAFMVAATNAMLVAFIGIILATILGVFVGIARLSTNWLVRKIAQVYVEAIRNIPALVQVVFWYTAVILAIPQIQNSFSVGGFAYVSNRGAAIPALRVGDNFGIWLGVVALGIVAAAYLWLRRTRINESTGRPSYRWLLAFAVVLGTALVADFIFGGVTVEAPELAERSYAGGLQMSPEFAGILIGLVIYTAAFIGEIVRGSILAVSKGQKEAGQALGLRPGQQLRLVVLPQALRIAVPPITNQYLNLWKNTSLAFIIGFPELINITTTVVNQSGHDLENFSLIVLIYLTVSLVLSAVMNVFNRLVALRGGG
jgi:general L-amino acid transport system permease protein